MPRMPKKRKKEFAFFLNDRGAEATMNSAGNASMDVNRVSGLSLSTVPTIYPNESKGGHHLMNCEFMIASTPTCWMKS